MLDYEGIVQGDIGLLNECGKLMYKAFFPLPASERPWEKLTTAEKAEFTNTAYQVEALVLSRISEHESRGGDN